MRKVLFWCHLAAGVAAGSVILVMAVTGILMAFEPQIVASVEKDLRFIGSAPGAQRLPLDDVAKRLAGSRNGALPTAITVRSDAAASLVFTYGRDGAVFADPYTAKALGKSSGLRHFFEWVEDIHRRLGAKEAGRNVTGAAALAFFFLIVSGLCLWWPKKWAPDHLRPILFFKPGLQGRQRDWNWHNVTGFWLAPVLLTIVVTGLVMAYPWANRLMFRMTGSEPPPAQAQKKPMAAGASAALPIVMPAAGLDAIFKEAARLSPDWAAITLRLGSSPDAPMTVQVEEASRTVSPRSQATFDSRTGKVLKWEPFEEQSLGRKMRFWFRYLHTGELLGPAGQLLMAVGASGAALLVFTGFALVIRRFAGWRFGKR